MHKVAYIDDLVEEYLHFRGFTGSLASFRQDRFSDDIHCFSPERIVKYIVSLIETDDVDNFLTYWDSLLSRYFSEMDSSVKTDLLFYRDSLLKYFIVNAVTTSNQHALDGFFSKFGAELLQNSDWIPWFRLLLAVTSSESTKKSQPERLAIALASTSIPSRSLPNPPRTISLTGSPTFHPEKTPPLPFSETTEGDDIESLDKNANTFVVGELSPYFTEEWLTQLLLSLSNLFKQLFSRIEAPSLLLFEWSESEIQYQISLVQSLRDQVKGMEAEYRRMKEEKEEREHVMEQLNERLLAQQKTVDEFNQLLIQYRNNHPSSTAPSTDQEIPTSDTLPAEASLLLPSEPSSLIAKGKVFRRRFGWMDPTTSQFHQPITPQDPSSESPIPFVINSTFSFTFTPVAFSSVQYQQPIRACIFSPSNITKGMTRILNTQLDTLLQNDSLMYQMHEALFPPRFPFAPIPTRDEKEKFDKKESEKSLVQNKLSNFAIASLARDSLLEETVNPAQSQSDSSPSFQHFSPAQSPPSSKGTPQHQPTPRFTSFLQKRDKKDAKQDLLVPVNQHQVPVANFPADPTVSKWGRLFAFIDQNGRVRVSDMHINTSVIRRQRVLEREVAVLNCSARIIDNECTLEVVDEPKQTQWKKVTFDPNQLPSSHGKTPADSPIITTTGFTLTMPIPDGITVTTLAWTDSISERTLLMGTNTGSLLLWSTPNEDKDFGDQRDSLKVLDVEVKDGGMAGMWTSWSSEEKRREYETSHAYSAIPLSQTEKDQAAALGFSSFGDQKAGQSQKPSNTQQSVTLTSHSGYPHILCLICSPTDSNLFAYSSAREPIKGTLNLFSTHCFDNRSSISEVRLPKPREGRFGLINISSGVSVTPFFIDPFPSAVHSLRFNHNGTLILAACDDGRVRMYDSKLQTNQLKMKHQPEEKRASKAGHPLFEWALHSLPVFDVIWINGDTSFISIGADGRILQQSVHQPHSPFEYTIPQLSLFQMSHPSTDASSSLPPDQPADTAPPTSTPLPVFVPQSLSAHDEFLAISGTAFFPNSVFVFDHSNDCPPPTQSILQLSHQSPVSLFQHCEVTDKKTQSVLQPSTPNKNVPLTPQSGGTTHGNTFKNKGSDSSVYVYRLNNAKHIAEIQTNNVPILMAEWHPHDSSLLITAENSISLIEFVEKD